MSFNKNGKIFILVLLVLTILITNSLLGRKVGTITFGGYLFALEVKNITVEYLSDYDEQKGPNYIELEEGYKSELINYLKDRGLDSWRHKDYISKLNANITHIIKIYYSDEFYYTLKYLQDTQLLLITGNPRDFIELIKNKREVSFLQLGSMDCEFDYILNKIYGVYN